MGGTKCTMTIDFMTNWYPTDATSVVKTNIMRRFGHLKEGISLLKVLQEWKKPTESVLKCQLWILSFTSVLYLDNFINPHYTISLTKRETNQVVTKEKLFKFLRKDRGPGVQNV